METWEVGLCRRALDNAEACGDRYLFRQEGGRVTLCVIDGLGHGAGAEEAALKAADYVARNLGKPLEDIFSGCNIALRQTRGVSMAVAVLEADSGSLTFAGIGNTRAVVYRSAGDAPAFRVAVRLAGNYGIVGGGYRRLSPETVPLRPADVVLMYTDGLPELIDISGYGPELFEDMQGLCERILQDWNHGADDAAVLALKYKG